MLADRVRQTSGGGGIPFASYLYQVDSYGQHLLFALDKNGNKITSGYNLARTDQGFSALCMPKQNNPAIYFHDRNANKIKKISYPTITEEEIPTESIVDAVNLYVVKPELDLMVCRTSYANNIWKKYKISNGEYLSQQNISRQTGRKYTLDACGNEPNGTFSTVDYTDSDSYFVYQRKFADWTQSFKGSSGSYGPFLLGGDGTNVFYVIYKYLYKGWSGGSTNLFSADNAILSAGVFLENDIYKIGVLEKNVTEMKLFYKEFSTNGSLLRTVEVTSFAISNEVAQTYFIDQVTKIDGVVYTSWIRYYSSNENFRKVFVAIDSNGLKLNKVIGEEATGAQFNRVFFTSSIG